MTTCFGNFFDGIMCITLKHRVHAKKVFADAGLDIEFVEGIRDADPYTGCKKSHLKCVGLAKERGYKNLLVFEDDVVFIRPLNYLDKAIPELPEDWELFYLGIRLKKVPRIHSKHLLRVKAGKTTHAVAYNGRVFDLILANPFSSMDCYCFEVMQPRKHCYCTRKVLASQLGRNINKKFKKRAAWAQR